MGVSTMTVNDEFLKFCGFEPTAKGVADITPSVTPSQVQQVTPPAKPEALPQPQNSQPKQQAKQQASTARLRRARLPVAASGGRSAADLRGGPRAPGERMELRLPAAARDELRKRARQARLQPCHLVTRWLLGQVVPFAVLDSKQWRELMGELRAVGRNLNQVARAANAGRVAGGDAAAAMRAVDLTLQAVIAAVERADGGAGR